MAVGEKVQYRKERAVRFERRTLDVPQLQLRLLPPRLPLSRLLLRLFLLLPLPVKLLLQLLAPLVRLSNLVNKGRKLAAKLVGEVLRLVEARTELAVGGTGAVEGGRGTGTGGG